MMDWRVVSIGTLATNPLREERGDRRPSHATTTLLQNNGEVILVDPSLPPDAMASRLDERSGLRLEDVSTVFLTNYHPDRWRSLPGLLHATWLMHEPEIEAATDAIDNAAAEAETADLIEQHRGWLPRFSAADDRIAPGVDLFPLPGMTIGTCGLLLPLPAATVLICGDAIATIEHLERGMVLTPCADLEAAQESIREAVEIADLLILGRDNVVLNPLGRQR